MKPFYTKKPIGSIEALSKALQVDIGVLKNTAACLDKHYHPHSIPKRDGTFRKISIPTNHLKIIQKRINRSIFSNVSYPNYLTGGIKEKDYVKNAASHSNAEAIISLDIKNFYPSITHKKVLEIFQYFCKFPLEVATLLADLCTFKNQVPQGACTSSHLANLIFHDSEYHFAQHCETKRYTYTRLLDDISISSQKKFSQKEIDNIITSVKKYVKRSGLSLNKKKQKITSRSNPEELMEVTGLWLNRGKPRVHHDDFNKIKAGLFCCETMAKKENTSEEYHKLHGEISGKVGKLSYLKYHKATEYRERLRKILPVYDENAANGIYKNAVHLSKSNKSIRSKFSYFQKYHILNYKVNILFRNNKSRANLIRNILKYCKPTGKKDELLYNEPI